MKSDIKTSYTAINYGYPNSVVFSQLIDYTAAMRDHGAVFKYNFLIPGGEFFSKRDSIFKVIRSSDLLKNSTTKVFPTPFVNYELFLKVYGAYIKHVSCKEPGCTRQIIHPRGLPSANIAYLLHKRDQSVRYLYDMRGDLSAEFEFRSKNSGVSIADIDRGKRNIERLETRIISNAGQVICVSEAMKEMAMNKYKIADGKVTVIPCCADEKQFVCNQELRERGRERFGFNGKFIVIYSGGLNHWHCSEELFDLVGRVLRSVQKAFFVVLTPQQDEAKSLASKYLPDGRFRVDEVCRDDVPGYLGASDLAIILRHNDPVNNVSSPTKIAEYLMAGLPVALTQNIGDYSSFVRHNGLGLVLDNEPLDLEKSKKDIVQYIVGGKLKTSRAEVANKGAEHFSKARYLPVLWRIYQNL
ncbi:MAG: glycosyltransferase [Desulfuromonadales bacterium]|nr:glycosyltransferase [Desulfuromonadales bacterium]